VLDAMSIVADFISLTSITIPWSTLGQPSRQWRRVRTRTMTSFCRAQATALTTSCVSWAKHDRGRIVGEEQVVAGAGDRVVGVARTDDAARQLGRSCRG
jgi:hypothetical protein